MARTRSRPRHRCGRAEIRGEIMIGDDLATLREIESLLVTDRAR